MTAERGSTGRGVGGGGAEPPTVRSGGRPAPLLRPPPVPRGPRGRERFADVVIEHALALATASIVSFGLAFVGAIAALAATVSFEDSGGASPPPARIFVGLVIGLAVLSVLAAFLGFGGAVAGIGRRVEGRNRPGEVHSVWALVVSLPVTLLGVAAIIGLLLSAD